MIIVCVVFYLFLEEKIGEMVCVVVYLDYCSLLRGEVLLECIVV